MNPKILFLDTENAPNVAVTWGIHEQRISDTDLIREWFFLSGQMAWDDSKQVNVVSILDDKKRFKKDFTDDYHVVSTIADWVRDADIVVGHNLKGHDWPKLMAKIVEYEIEPLKKVQLIDTLEWSKSFGFTSRKLSALCRKLSLTEKLTHAPGVFLKAAMGNPDAIAEIVRYGKGDIPTLRDLYYRLRPYAPRHPNMNLFRGSGIVCCPYCSSTEFKKDGPWYSLTRAYQGYRCSAKRCRRYFSSSKSIKSVGVK